MLLDNGATEVYSQVEDTGLCSNVEVKADALYEHEFKVNT